MLVEHYPTDKRFEDLLRYFPELSPELKKIDSYLEDEKVYRLIRDDLAKRYPKTKETGRPSTPAEVVLRMLVVKRLYGYSYAETERVVRDSLSLRQFCRVYLNDVPDEKTLIRWAKVIQAKTLEKFNERIMQLAVERKVTRGCKLRTDGTVVESNIRAPSDNRLLADGVRVLARTVVRARELLQQKVQEPFEDFTQAAKQRARQIGETLRKKTEAAKSVGRQHYQELIEMTQKTIESARHIQKQLHEMQEQKAKRLAQSLETFLPRAEQVIDQTTRRIMQGEQVPASEKIVSLFEEHTDIICRGKESRPVEYGHKIWLNEVEGGLVSHYRILDGNPSDADQWKPSLKAHLKTFHQSPQQASGDRGLYSEPNEQLAHDLGVKKVILPQPGYRSKTRLKQEHKAWFVQGRHWHAGVEGRISVLKRAHDLGRCLAHGLNGFQCWVGWGIIAGNLAVLGRT
ncbi:MAG: ISNCY family transposase [Geobacteraceae bacterium]|nr:MAG: ISNCY family transposase [Geobacteraceae bacterium]